MTSFGIRPRRLSPELVIVTNDLAGPITRGVAAAIDGLAILIVVAVLLGGDGWPGGGADVPLMLGALVVGTAAMEMLWRGRSLGKAAVGLRVRSVDGGPVGAGQLALRNLLRVIDAMPPVYGLGLASILLTRRAQRIGDVVSGTVVVVDPMRRRGTGRVYVAPPATLPPPGMAGPWAQPAPVLTAPPAPLPPWDVMGLSADDLAVVRRFLVRRWELDHASRAFHAIELWRHVFPLVPGAPGNLPAELFLETVARLADRAAEQPAGYSSRSSGRSSATHPRDTT